MNSCNRPESELRLLVLAGGFGTRLRSVVPNVPKPMAPVRGTSFLQYLMENWVRQGISSMTLLLHDRAEHIEEFLGSRRKERWLENCAVDTLVEDEPLGTGGAIANAVQQLQISGSFLVANADTWLGTGVMELSEASEPAIAIVEVSDTSRYGEVVVQDNTVLSFSEKQCSSARGWINAGLYKLHSNLFQYWNGEAFSLERDLFPTLAESGRLSVSFLQSDFVDIGIPEDYLRFCRWIDSGKEGRP